MCDDVLGCYSKFYNTIPYNYLKDFVVPVLSIGLSVAVAYWVAKMQIDNQIEIKRKAAKRKKFLLLSVVHIQNQLLIADLSKRHGEMAQILNNLEKEDVSERLNGIYLPSLVRLNEIDSKACSLVWLFIL